MSSVPQDPRQGADENPVIVELIDNVVDGVPGVIGAVIASADGFELGSRLPEGADFDASAMAAMSAATLGLAKRLVQMGGDHAAEVCQFRSANAQVWVFAVGVSAAVTIVATAEADRARIDLIGHEVASGLAPLFET
jgi:predicted regulator of Ras-like GTPase activity (Roadblock/LC7/MglB family)